MKCPECGTETVWRNSVCPKCGRETRKAANNSSEDAMKAFFEGSEKRIKEQSAGKESNAPNGGFCKWLIAFSLFGTLAIAMSINDRDMDSVVVAVLMTVLVLCAYLLETGVIRTRKKSLSVVIFVAAFVLIFPYFALYSPLSGFEEKADSVIVVENLDEEKTETDHGMHMNDTVKKQNVTVESARTGDEEKYENGSVNAVAAFVVEDATDEGREETGSEQRGEWTNEEAEASGMSGADVGMETDETSEVEEGNPEYTDEDADIQKTAAVVYITPKGKKYHLEKTCPGKNAIAATWEYVLGKYDPCKKCAQ